MWRSSTPPSYKTALAHIENNSPIMKTYYPENYSEEENSSLIKALADNTSVTKIDYNFDYAPYPLTQSAIAELPNILATNKGLKKIILGCHSSPEFITSLAKNLLDNQKITEVRLTGSLNEEHYYDEALLHLGDWIEKSPSLKHVALSVVRTKQASTIKILANKLSNSKNLNSLELYHGTFNEKGVMYFADLFAKNKKLKDLHLYRCGIDDESAVYFANKLIDVTKVQAFAFTSDLISNNGLQCLAVAVLKNPNVYIHFLRKKDNGTLFRFESEFISPFLKRDAKKILKQYWYSWS
ncbi:MAG: hypothetical protein LCH30_00905 [Proteobacteria bacterium]|nr:hypothetical protein [Pseudomonadota bacterium]